MKKKRTLYDLQSYDEFLKAVASQRRWERLLVLSLFGVGVVAVMAIMGAVP